MANQKFHISKNGTPEICSAKIKCRLSPENEHFNSFEEAQDFADRKNEIEELESRKELLKKSPYFASVADTIYNIGIKDEQYFNQDKETQQALKLWKETENKYNKDNFNNAVIESLHRGYISPTSSFIEEWYQDRKYYNDFPVDGRLAMDDYINNEDLKEEFK